MEKFVIAKVLIFLYHNHKNYLHDQTKPIIENYDFLSHLLQTVFLPFQFCLSVRHIDRLDGKFEESRQIEIMIICRQNRKWNHLKKIKFYRSREGNEKQSIDDSWWIILFFFIASFQNSLLALSRWFFVMKKQLICNGKVCYCKSVNFPLPQPQKLLAW
jgi:hypothetical protein